MLTMLIQRALIFVIFCLLFFSCKKEKKKSDYGNDDPLQTSFAIRNNNGYLLNAEVCNKSGCIQIQTLEAYEVSSAYIVEDTVLFIQYQILDKHVVLETPYIIHYLKHNEITITDEYDPYPGKFDEY